MFRGNAKRSHFVWALSGWRKDSQRLQENRQLHKQPGEYWKELNRGFHTQRRVAKKMQMAATSRGRIQTLHFPVILAITFN